MAHSIYILIDGTTPKAPSLAEAIRRRLNWLCDELRKSVNEYRLAVFSYGAINFNTILPLSNVKEATAPLNYQPQVGFRSLGAALAKVARIVTNDRRNYPDDNRLLYVVSHGIPLPKLKKAELDEKMLPCGFSKKTVILLGDSIDDAPGEYLPLTPNIYKNRPDELFNNVLSDVGAAIRRPASPILASTVGRKSTTTAQAKTKADSAPVPASSSLPPPILPALKPKKVKIPPPLPPLSTEEKRKSSAVKADSPAISVETQLLRTQNQALLEKVQDLESQLSARTSMTVAQNGLTAKNKELEKKLSSAQAKLAELESALSTSGQASQAQQETEARLAEQDKTLSATKKKLAVALSENERLKQQILEQTAQQKEQVSLLSSKTDEKLARQDQKIADLQAEKQTLEQKVLAQAALQTELEMTKQMWTQAQEFNKSLQSQVEGLKRIVGRQKEQLAEYESNQTQAKKLETAISSNHQELTRLQQELAAIQQKYTSQQQENNALRKKYAELENDCKPYLTLLNQQKENEARAQKRKEAEERQKAKKKKEEHDALFGSDDFPSDIG